MQDKKKDQDQDPGDRAATRFRVRGKNKDQDEKKDQDPGDRAATRSQVRDKSSGPDQRLHQRLQAGRKSPVATKNLLEVTDGLRRPPLSKEGDAIHQ